MDGRKGKYPQKRIDCYSSSNSTIFPSHQRCCLLCYAIVIKNKEKKSAPIKSSFCKKGAATSFKRNRAYLRLRNLTHQTAIVTGCGRGIGKETAILLSRMGLNVVICSRTQNEIDSTVDQIKEIIIDTNHSDGVAAEGRILGIKCDVSKSSEVNYLVKSTVEIFKNIDILIN